MNDNAGQDNAFDLHAFEKGIQWGSYECAVLMLDDDNLALYGSHFLLDPIPGTMNVIAGGGVPFIMLYVKDRPTIRSPVPQQALDDGHIIGVAFISPHRLIDSILNIENNQGNARRIPHRGRLLTMGA